MEQILKDLEDLRIYSAKPKHRDSRRAFAKDAGINYGIINRVETRENKRGVSVQDLSRWLEACGSSLALYFGQLAVMNDLEVLKEDIELAEKFKKAVKIPAKRTMLKAFLDGLFADEQRPDKTQPESRARPNAPSGVRSGKRSGVA